LYTSPLHDALPISDFPESDYPETPRNDDAHRALVAELVDKEPQRALIDARSAEEFKGEPTAYSANGDSQYGTTFRHGHIPGATHIKWDAATYPNATFRPFQELNKTYGELRSASEVILYSHVGAQSAHTWFVL